MPSNRVDVALSQLVDALIPALADEDEVSSEARHAQSLDLAKAILAKYAFAPILKARD